MAYLGVHIGVYQPCPDLKRTLVAMSERTGMSVSQVTDEVLYTGLIEMQELWWVGSSLATFTDGYFRNIAESVVNAEILQKHNEAVRDV